MILLPLESAGSPPQTPVKAQNCLNMVISLEAAPAQSSHLFSVATAFLGKSEHYSKTVLQVSNDFQLRSGCRFCWPRRKALVYLFSKEGKLAVGCSDMG